MLQFDEQKHEYTLDGKKLISVTQLMQKHGLAPSYEGVSSEVLNAKAQRGSMIHKEIEEYNKQGLIGFTQELTNFIDYTKAHNVKVIDSELMLHNDIVAGTTDLVLKENSEYIIADIKTTYTLHKEAVSWQLSIYAYLLNDPKMGYEVTKGQAYHFDKDSNINVVDIPLKPVEEVAKLMQCERNGVIYNREIQGTLGDLTQLIEVEELIAHLETQKKAYEAKAQEMRQALLDAMENNAITNYENERIKVTYVAPTTRVSIDSAKLKKDLPEIADKYQKTSNVKASLRITIKEAKTNE